MWFSSVTVILAFRNIPLKESRQVWAWKECLLGFSYWSQTTFVVTGPYLSYTVS